jgi:hypothetical protein
MAAGMRQGSRWHGPAVLWLLLIVALAAPVPATAADEARLWLTVTRPYEDLRTGPGRGYPVFHVIERGAAFTLIRQRTDWVMVATRDGRRGWMHRQAVEAAESPGGGSVSFGGTGRADWLQRRVELGLGGGDFDGDPLFSFRAGYRLGAHFLLEAQLLQAAGSFSSTTIYQANLQVLPFLDWRVSPFFSIGAGRMKNEPKSTLVDAADVSEWSGNAALGVRGWVTRRFLARADVRHHVLTRDINNNDDFTELALGFSVFF